MLLAMRTLVPMKHHPRPRLHFGLRILMIFVAVFFVHHMACTLIYIAPYKPWGNRVDRYASSYIYPYFFQGWKLFAPDVNEYYYTLEYRHLAQGRWSDFAPVHTLDGVQMKQRIQKIEFRLLAHLMRDVAKQVEFDEASPDFATVATSTTYGRVAFYAFRRHQLAKLQQPDSMQLQLRTVYTPEFKTSLEMDDRVYVFPVFPVENE